MSQKLITGVYAAVITPRHPDGLLDEAALCKQVEFLMERGVHGLAINGATGEFCLNTSRELERILALVSGLISGRTRFVCGIGSAGLLGSLEFGRVAIQAGAAALLLPAPYFFPYAQDDLEAFYRKAADSLPAPILLYNLPQFTSGLEPATAHRLIADCPNIVGIKDSSGLPDILEDLTRSEMDACRIVGNDSVLAPALRGRLCDGVISGVAGVLPELIQGLFATGSSPESAQFQQAAHSLEEFIRHIDGLPTPWGLKWIAESRGIARASFSQPLSPRRIAQGRELQGWFQAWYPSLALP